MIVKKKSIKHIKIKNIQVNLVTDPNFMYVINRNFISDTRNKTKEGICIHIVDLTWVQK